MRKKAMCQECGDRKPHDCFRRSDVCGDCEAKKAFWRPKPADIRKAAKGLYVAAKAVGAEGRPKRPCKLDMARNRKETPL